MTRPTPLLNADGSFRIRRVGVPLSRFADAYHFFMKASWPMVGAVIFGTYFLANSLFAALYLLNPSGVEGLKPGFWSAFSFSVQTMASIGYGGMYPISAYAHTVVFFESFVGLFGVALATGLLFAKFSRPTAKVGFSDTMVVHERNGVPTLMFRMANERNNQIVEARVTMSVLLDEVTAEGDRMRRLRDLPLERQISPLFSLSWLAFHPLDEHSVIQALPDGVNDAQIRGYIITFSGLDGTFSQTVHARKLYGPDVVRIGEQFSDMISDAPDGRIQIDHRLLSKTEPWVFGREE
ncbi:MAG: ion channel [Myxococcota bacterium]